MNAIYEPRGAAAEYAPLACNLYRGCGHGCKYCYAPACLRMGREEFARPAPRPGILDALGKLEDLYEARYFYPVVNHIARSDMFGMYGRHLGSTRLYNFDLSDRIVPVILPFYATSLPALAMMIRMSHTVDRYLNAFRRGSGTVKPTGHVSYRDGKTKKKVKVFNWSGGAKDDYI